MTEQLNLTLSEHRAVKADFTARYVAANPEVSFLWDIKVNWLQLVTAIENNITWPADETVLRFIHRYEENRWFLTMECCHVDSDNNIDIFGARFDLKTNSIQATTRFTADYDQDYFDNIYYDSKPLVKGTHISNLKFPWVQELKEAAGVNAVIESENADIVFSSITFDYGEEPTQVKVQWPHSLAFFFSGPTGDLLDNVAYGGTFVKSKAYDYARPCPNDCANVYVWPTF